MQEHNVSAIELCNDQLQSADCDYFSAHAPRVASKQKNIDSQERTVVQKWQDSMMNDLQILDLNVLTDRSQLIKISLNGCSAVKEVKKRELYTDRKWLKDALTTKLTGLPHWSSVCLSDRTISIEQSFYVVEGGVNSSIVGNLELRLKGTITPTAVTGGNTIVFESPDLKNNSLIHVLQNHPGRRGLGFGHSAFFRNLASCHQISTD